MIWGFDTETHLIRPGLLAPKLVCGSVACEKYTDLMNSKETLDWAWGELLINDSHIIGTRLSYDLGVLCAADPDLVRPIFAALEEGRLHDISIRQALIDIANGTLAGDWDEEAGIRYSLANLSKRYLGIDLSEEKTAPDAWRLRYSELDGIPFSKWPWSAIRYPLRDACFPLEIYKLQEGQPNLHDETRQMRADFALHLCSLWGLRTNRGRVEALEAEVEREWLQARRELQTVGIFRDDFTKDTKRLAELVVLAYSPESPPSTPRGKISTDRDTLLESGNEILIKLGNTGKNDKRKSTYLPILKKGLDQPWNPSFNTLVATGRASGDAQQFPTGNRSGGGIRECFEPRPGYCYCSVDYGGLELRTMSQRSIWTVGYSKMAEFLNTGKDCHCHVAGQFMNKPYEDVLKNKKKSPYDKFRDLGKIFNFGKGGGMGAAAMAYNAREKDEIRFCLTTGAATKCGVNKVTARVKGKDRLVCAECVEISKRFGRDWLEAWPEQRDLFALASTETQNGVVPVTVPVSKRVRGGCRYTQWLNTPFQGLGGDLAKDAMWRVSREMYCDKDSPLFGSRLVLMVHDELIAETPLDRAPEAAERMAKIMRDTAAEWLPDLGPSIEAEPAISLIMSKKMATVRDEKGRLKLWTP